MTMSASMSESSTVLAVVMAWMEEEDDEKGKVKGFSLSEQVRVVLERENKFFLGMKEGNSKFLRGEVKWFFFRRTKSFGVGRTKIGGLNLMIAGTFSSEINNCFFIRSDLARSCRWNSTSWAES